MGQLSHRRVAHRRRHALDRVDSPEKPIHRLDSGRLFFPLEQRAVAGFEMLAAFRKKQRGVLGQVHGLRQDALYRLENTGRLEGLHDEILGPGLDRFDHQSLLSHGAAHQDLGFGV